jgi:hypothetical protein
MNSWLVDYSQPHAFKPVVIAFSLTIQVRLLDYPNSQFVGCVAIPERVKFMNVRRAVAPVVCLLACVWSSPAQQREDAGRMYERIYAIVPMIGSGTLADPKRPMFIPAPGQRVAGDRTGIIAFNSVTSDDGTVALVEIITATKTDLAPIKAQITAQIPLTAGVQLFDRNSTMPSVVQAAFQSMKKNFDITKFRVVVP